MKPQKQLLATFSVLLIAALLAACVSPAVAPRAGATHCHPHPTANDARSTHARADACRRDIG